MLDLPSTPPSTRLVIVNNYHTPYRHDLFAAIQKRAPAEVVYVSRPEAKRRRIGWEAMRNAPGVYHCNDPAIVAKGSGRRLSLPFRAAFVIFRLRPEVLVCNLSRDMVLTQLVCLAVARLRGARLAYWVGDVLGPDEGGRLTRAVDRLRLFCVRRANGIICYSPHSLDWLKAHLPNAPPRLLWIGGQVRHAIGGEDILPADPRPRHPVLRILVIGGDEPRKGIAQLIEDISAMEVPTGRQIELLVAGTLDTGRRRHGHLRILHLGSLKAEAMRQAYAWADLAVIASSREPWGFVFNEAILAGRPCVVSAAAGSATVAARYGLRYNPGDPADLAQAVSCAMAMRPEEVADIANRLSVVRAAGSFHLFADMLSAGQEGIIEDY